MSTLFSITRTDKISHQTKRVEMKNIYDDETIREAQKVAITDSKIKRFTKVLYGTPFPFFCSIVTISGHLEYRLPKLIEIFKRNY